MEKSTQISTLKKYQNKVINLFVYGSFFSNSVFKTGKN